MSGLSQTFNMKSWESAQTFSSFEIRKFSMGQTRDI